MSTKVVINCCYGGFSLSRGAVEHMAVEGNKECEDMLKDSDWGSFDLYDTPRHDKLLVKAVEELGERANGDTADLQIIVIEGNKYIIEQYDGAESVKTPEDIEWITVS